MRAGSPAPDCFDGEEELGEVRLPSVLHEGRARRLQVGPEAGLHRAGGRGRRLAGGRGEPVEGGGQGDPHSLMHGLLRPVARLQQLGGLPDRGRHRLDGLAQLQGREGGPGQGGGRCGAGRGPGACHYTFTN